MRAIQTHRWTREEYDRLVEQGILTEDDRVELIEGEIVAVAPQNAPHATTLRLVEEALRAAFGEGFDVRPALPFIAGDDSEPEPDLAVVKGRPRDFVRMHPTSAALVVEISDSSLAFDRRRKARVYARAGVPEYWIVNLPDHTIEVYRGPHGAAGAPDEARYEVRLVFGHADTVTPLAAPSARIPVSDLLP